MPCRGARGHEWHGTRRGAFVGGAAGGGIIRAATAGDGMVYEDGRVRVGVLYLIVGAVADCLVGLGRVTRHGCSVACWKRKAI